MSNPNIQTEVLNRLKTVKGHIAGVERMVGEQQACSDIMIQLSAIRSSIEKIGIFILENNAVECLCGDLRMNTEEKAKIEQVIKQMLLFLK